MSYEYEDIYTPQTAVVEAGQQALVLRQEKLQLEMQEWRQELERKGEELRQFHLQVEEDKSASRREQAEVWAEQDKLKSEKAILETEYALVIRDKQALIKRENEHLDREDRRRRDRTLSMAFIEDSFAKLGALDVLTRLNDSRVRIKKHAMNNISFCINGPSEVPPSFVRFGASTIAPQLLPELEKLLLAGGTTRGPLDFEVQFSEEVVSSPPMARALALSGQCPRLAEYLVRKNEVISRLAISSLGQMIRSEPAIAKIAYAALTTAVNNIPIPNTPSEFSHPSIKFFQEVSPKIIGECFSNGRWTAVAPLVQLKIDSIRRVVLPKIVTEAQFSDRVRFGLVEAGTMHLLEDYYKHPQPPPDTIEFFTGVLPLLAQKLCRHPRETTWLVERLANSNARINTAVIEALRTSSRKEDSTIHDVFVKADILRSLDNPPTQASPAVTKLICDLLPVLAIPHAKSKTCSRLLGFLDHAEGSVASACLVACKKVVDSSVENRAHLYSEFSKLSFTKESTLKLCDHAIPLLCRDWATSGDFAKISKLNFDPEQRVRLAAHPVWRDLISNSPDARAKISLDEIFQLCSSTYDDCVALGSHLLPFMATEIAKAGASSTGRLVSLLTDPRSEMRQAVLRSIQIISESNDANCEVLRAANTFYTLKLGLQANPHDGVESAHKILVRLAPFLSDSYEACCGLVQLLDSKVPQVESAARAALVSISYRNIDYRETLRQAMLECLDLASDTLLEFSAHAIQEWIGPDLAQLNDFEKLFHLVSHRDRRIQNGALFSLKQTLQNEKYHESLEKAGVVTIIHSLSNTDNTEAINFAAFALRPLALTLARTGHVSEILQLLTNEVPKIREGASAAIQDIANATEHDRECLLGEDILQRLTGGDEGLGQTALQLSAIIIPKLTVTYIRAEKVQAVITLVDHKQQHIRTAASTALTAIGSKTEDERRSLRNALLPLSGDASGALRDVVSTCLSQALARDLVSDGDYKQIFGLLENEDPRIRAPVISDLQHHILTSSEAVRRRLVDAGILKAILQGSTNIRIDLVSFTADCMLPILGPSFTQSDGGESVIPLLKHKESRIRAAAATAIRNGVESRHGSPKNIANARIVSYLHSAIQEAVIQDLWCFVLPKISPFISDQYEIEVLFDSLSDSHSHVRQAASEAISVLAKTSDETRLHLFPALLPRLEGPPAHSQRQIAQAISLSGFAFASNGKETELLLLIQHGEPPLLEAAVDAVIHLLSEGSSSERQKLMEAEVFLVALELHGSGSQRRLSLKLLDSIIRHLSDVIILNEGLAALLLCLFDDPDIPLSRTLFQSLTRVVDDGYVSETSTLPQLLPILLDRQGKPPAARLLCHLAPHTVPRLFKFRRVDIIMKLLLDQKDASIAKAYLPEVHASLANATSRERDILADEPQFLSALGDFLKTRDVTLRRAASDIVAVLSMGSPLRSSRLVEEGICSSLALISIRGGTDAQASLQALSALFLTAPDHTDQHFKDIFPALCDILHADHHPVEVYISALCFLKDIAPRAPIRVIVESGVLEPLIMWLNPQHSNLAVKCRQHVFEVCQKIAEQSDPGRKALIDRKILQVLLRLAADSTASNVIGACGIMKALAYSGTYRSDMISLGVKDSMDKITGTFYKSTLEKKTDKKLAQDAAKEVLVALKPTTSPASPSTSNILRSFSLSKRPSMNQLLSSVSLTDVGSSEGASPGHLARSFSEYTTYSQRSGNGPRRMATDPGRGLAALQEDDDD